MKKFMVILLIMGSFILIGCRTPEEIAKYEAEEKARIEKKATDYAAKEKQQEERRIEHEKSFKFQIGEVVKIKVDGRKAVVLSRWDKRNDSCKSYMVRIAINEVLTDTKILSSDGPLKLEAYKKMEVDEFELEKIAVDVEKK